MTVHVLQLRLHFRPPSNENTNAWNAFSLHVVYAALFRTLYFIERRFWKKCCDVSDLLFIFLVSFFIIGFSCLGTFQCTLFQNYLLRTRRKTLWRCFCDKVAITAFYHRVMLHVIDSFYDRHYIILRDKNF
jgi:hypothetical protein